MMRSRPSAIAERTEDLSVLGPFNEATGDFWVEFSGIRYWMGGGSTFEAFRMRRLTGARLLR